MIDGIGGLATTAKEDKAQKELALKKKQIADLEAQLAAAREVQLNNENVMDLQSLYEMGYIPRNQRGQDLINLNMYY